MIKNIMEDVGQVKALKKQLTLTLSDSENKKVATVEYNMPTLNNLLSTPGCMDRRVPSLEIKKKQVVYLLEEEILKCDAQLELYFNTIQVYIFDE